MRMGIRLDAIIDPGREELFRLADDWLLRVASRYYIYSIATFIATDER